MRVTRTCCFNIEHVLINVITLLIIHALKLTKLFLHGFYMALISFHILINHYLLWAINNSKTKY